MTKTTAVHIGIYSISFFSQFLSAHIEQSLVGSLLSWFVLCEIPLVDFLDSCKLYFVLFDGFFSLLFHTNCKKLLLWGEISNFSNTWSWISLFIWGLLGISRSERISLWCLNWCSSFSWCLESSWLRLTSYWCPTLINSLSLRRFRRTGGWWFTNLGHSFRLFLWSGIKSLLLLTVWVLNFFVIFIHQ